MQPYLFPYAGYFQLVAAADRFVFYDDVNFIKNGWINRNRLVLSGAARYFTVPLDGASSFRKISETRAQPPEVWRRKLLESIRQSYSRAPFFSEVFELVENVLGDAAQMRIGEMAKASVVAVARYLGLSTEFVWTSATYRNEYLSGAERVIDICRREAARHYYNLPGGRSLYDPAMFASAGIELHIIDVFLPEYSHGKQPVPQGLSILDVLMWNDVETVSAMVSKSGRVP